MKIVSLVSGGIDSPTATALALETAEVVCLHFDTFPFGDKNQAEKVKKIVKHLSELERKKIKLIIVPFSGIQKEIIKNTERKLACVLCRKIMLELAEKIALQEGASGLLTGESLAQVASQTLSNLAAENSIGLPVLRPLLGMDKIEIEKIAKQKATYSYSIEKGSCCSLAPKQPATKAKKEKIAMEAEKISVKAIEEALKEKEEIVFGE